MTATQYFESQKLTFFKPQRTNRIDETHTLNYHIITLITREIVDSLLILSEKKLISKKDIAYFEKMGNADNDFLYDLYKKNGKADFVVEDFYRVVDFFKAQANMSLSEFQKNNEPLLLELLSTIFGLKFIKTNITTVALSLGKIPENSTMRIVDDKINELQKLFTEKYSRVSNNKSFDFEKFVPLYKKIQKMNHRQFLELTDDFNSVQ